MYFKDSQYLQACQEKVAFYAHDVMYDGISNFAPCALGSLETSRIENQGIGLMKNSPYTETINY